MKRSLLTLGVLLWLAINASSQAPTKRALIIGIDAYQPAGTTAEHLRGCAYGQNDAEGRCKLGVFPNLQGAVNDAQSMADVLTGPKYGFPADKVALLTNPKPAKVRPGIQVLPAAETDHDGILAAMQKYLVDDAHKGDTVVFYDASHGSLRVNTAGDKLTVRTEQGKVLHVDSTLVPSDAYKGGFDVRDREMTRIFNAALEKGVNLTVIIDSCHSGGFTRGVGGPRQRSLPYDPRPITDAEKLPNPTERAGNPALVFSAVQQDQSANETDPTDASPEIHGAFTAALLETLQILPADAPASLVYQRVKAVLEGQGTIGQEPDLDAGTERRMQPLFGGNANSADAGKVRAAALKTDDDGGVWLDIGAVAGIGRGSEFTASIPNAQGHTIKLRIDEPLGIARSKASILSPSGAHVAVGEVFELTRLVPAQSNPLSLWVGPSNISQTDLLAAVAAVEASKIATISDAAEEPYSAVLRWDGTQWILELVSSPAPSPKRLGATLSAKALLQAVPAGAKVWVDLPPFRELVASFNLTSPDSEAQLAKTVNEAHYLLTGTLVNGSPAYAWFHKEEYAAGPAATYTADHSPGCSTTSPYPVRSDWASVNVAQPQDAADTLNTYSRRLARVHGWLQLADGSQAGASTENFYKLELIHVTDETPVPAGETAYQDDRVRLALHADRPVKTPRWVYVLDIDCRGTGTLLYPRNYSENQYPSEDDSDVQVVLRHAPVIRIGSPFGLDSIILLSTSQPLSDPYVLDFEGVGRSASRGVRSPLESLLSNASDGTRSLQTDVEIPTDWGIEVHSLRTVPGPVK